MIEVLSNLDLLQNKCPELTCTLFVNPVMNHFHLGSTLCIHYQDGTPTQPLVSFPQSESVLIFLKAIFSHCTVVHSPFTKAHQSFSCWNTSGIGSFLLSDLLMIDGGRTNGDPKLLSAMKGSVAPSLIN